ncbi:MAG TPA: hypothetical protein PLE30_09630 [Candidatus Kapabacteria bacterium]|nr:hypothetical protein [Candidatus Kapabacteria bacterium]
MENKENNREFKQVIDLYWKTSAVYGFVLILYSLLVGTWEQGNITLKIFDPIVILLSIILIFSLFTLISRYYRQKVIIISENQITFSSRFGKKVFNFTDIEFIKFTKERIYKTRRKYSVVKIKFKYRKRMLRVRPSAFENGNELLSILHKLT